MWIQKNMTSILNQSCKADTLCIQDTRWKGSKDRSIGGGFILFYHVVDRKRNGVVIILKEGYVRSVLEDVSRKREEF